MLNYSEMSERRIGELGRELAQLTRARAQQRESETRQMGQVGLSEREIEQYSVLRALGEFSKMKQANRPWSLDGIEGEAHRAIMAKIGEPRLHTSLYIPPEILRRDLTAGTGSAGGFLVGSTTGGSFIEMLRNRSFAFRLGARRLPGQRDNLAIPRQSGAASVTWLPTEGTSTTESQQTLGQIASTPKTVAGFTEISRQLLLQSNPSAEQLVISDLSSICALAADDAVANGTGADGQPTGILNTAGVGTFTGTSLDLAALSSAQLDVLTGNAILDPSTLGYVTTPAVADVLKKRPRFSGTDTPVWQGPLHDGMIEGVRAISTLQIPTATMIYGDFSQVLVPEWGMLMLEVDPFTKFKQAILGVRAMWSIDVIIRHAVSFTIASSIT